VLLLLVELLFKKASTEVESDSSFLSGSSFASLPLFLLCFAVVKTAWEGIQGQTKISKATKKTLHFLKAM